MSFFEEVSSHTAGSHLSRLMGESSKIVPTLTVNCFWQDLHRQIVPRVLLWIVQMPLASQPLRGHLTPCGHLICARKALQTSGSAKNRIASSSVAGALSFFMHKEYHAILCLSSDLLPNLGQAKAKVTYDPKRTSPERLVEAVNTTGFKASM